MVTMSTLQLLVHSREFHAKCCLNSFASFTLDGKSAPSLLLCSYAACVSYPHLLEYALKVTSRKWCNMPHVTRIHGNDPEFSARIYWFTRVCGHPYLPTYFFLISFRVVFLRNSCSVTNLVQLTTNALKENIRNKIRQIDSMTLGRSIDNMQRRIQIYLTEDGSHFQHMV